MLGTETIDGNFTKFLVDRRGNVAERFASMTKLQLVESAIDELLASPSALTHPR